MVYGYVRVSTDKQTTENQRFEIEKFTKSRNMRIDRWVDETISGTKVIADRQLGKLLKQIRKGDILITTELSRLGRNLMQVMSFLHQCMERDIIVFTVKDKYKDQLEEIGNISVFENGYIYLGESKYEAVDQERFDELLDFLRSVTKAS